jgi:hypothetical protein
MSNKYEYSSGAVDITYDAFFAAPLLDLPRISLDVLKRFHEIISPRYTVPLSGLQSTGGNSLADVRLRVELFDGKGIFELTPQKLAVNFANIISSEDIEIIKDCLTLALDAVKSSIPDADISGEIIRSNCVLQISDGEFVASGHFDKFFHLRGIFNPELYGATDVRNGLRTQFANSEELWRMFFDVSPNSSVNSSIDFSLMATYERGSKYSSVYEKSRHMETVTDAYLGQIGLIAKRDVNS